MKVKLSKIAAGLMFASALAISVDGAAEPNERTIYVNGAKMNSVEIVALDYLNCGNTVPSGRYWVDWVSRGWGYEGGVQQGWLPTDCAQQAQESEPQPQSGSGGYWEDRMFERYGIDTIHFPTYQ